MERIDEKDLDKRIRVRNLSFSDAEEILNRDNGLPENIEALDKALAEAVLSGRVKDLGELDEVASFLESAGLCPSDKDKEELALLLCSRVIEGQSSYDGGASDRRKESRSLLDRLKDRESVKRILALNSKDLSDELFYKVMIGINHIDQIDKILEKGLTYEDAFTTCVFRDCPRANHAFLNHIEERFNTTIKDYSELTKLARLENQPQEDVKNCYFMALEDRYYMALEQVLFKGGRLADLEAINIKDFNLPDSWEGFNGNSNKEKMIERAIFFYFSLGESLSFRPSLKDIAEEIKAPYPMILKIYNDYHL
jgi:hypothetical protein